MDPFYILNHWTDRQVRTTLAWLHERWNDPDRTDHYLMRVAQRVQQSFSKSGKASLDQQKIVFKEKVESKVEPKAGDKGTGSSGTGLKEPPEDTPDKSSEKAIQEYLRSKNDP